MAATAGQPRPASPRTARMINDRTAYELLLAYGPLTRAELGARTGLSGPTVSELLTRLEQGGIVTAVGAADGARRGPRARLYAVVPDRAHVAAVGVTSHEVKVRIADVTGTTVGSATVPMDQTAPSGLLVQGAVSEAATDAGVPVATLGRVVVGVPGLVDPLTGDLTFVSSLPRWSGRFFGEVRSLLPVPVTLENEVNLAGLAERHLGAGRDVDTFALIWLDEGVAAAYVINGRLHRGRSGGAGELSFLPLGDGRTLQSLVSGDALAKQGRAYGLRGRAAHTLVGRAIAAGAEGEPFLDAVAERVAVAVGATCTVLDPGTVILAGAVGRAGGSALADRVAERIGLGVPLPTSVLSTTVPGDPVIGGAVHVALDLLLQDTFRVS